jgi:ubiquinone/menaquinone biosynthesis C-methylase UbiE
MMPSSRERETQRVKAWFDKHAGDFDKRIAWWERRLFEGGREWVCSRAQGDVLEIGTGTGRNLGLFPANIRLTGVELSPSMLEIARERASAMALDIDLRVGDAQVLEFPDASFDTVVSTLTLCSIPDAQRAVEEFERVLRPGGRLVMLEHVRSPASVVRAVQRALNPISVRFQADHLTREPLDYLRPAGFEVEEIERSKWGIVERVSARKPEGG